MSNEARRPNVSRKEAFQRHYNLYAYLALTDPDILSDVWMVKQAELALDRRLNGEAEHYVDANGIKIVIDP